MKPLLVLLTLCAVLTLGLWTATQYEARYVPASVKGVPWGQVMHYPVYRPYAMLGWWWQVDQRTRQTMSGSVWIFYGTCLVGMFATSLVIKLGSKKKTLATAMAARSGAPWLRRRGQDS